MCAGASPALPHPSRPPVTLPAPGSRRLPLHLLTLSLSLKLLLFPARASTDFDVHRHWKALTAALPLSRWYVDTSSPWTLDYPPLFAYFECLLSHVASLLHPALFPHPLPSHPSPSARFFMRASVLLPEPLLLHATLRLSAALAPNHPSRRPILPAAFVLLSPGLTLVDNLHFQYNALPLSLLLLSLALFHRSRPVPAALIFSAALNLKHTLLPLAPAVAVYILATTPHSSPTFPRFLISLAPVALATLAAFAAIWGPLYIVGRAPLLRHVLSRIFPFARGLLHAYWAPNFWALYAFADKLLSALGLAVRPVDIDPASGRIGASAPFATLPNPTPVLCATALLAVLIPMLLRLAARPRRLVLAVVYSALAAFFLGWHVHEKAVLVPLLPLAVLAGVSDDWRVHEAFLWLSVAGQFALFPLVDGGIESVFKIAHFLAYHAFAAEVLLRRKWCWRHTVLLCYAVGTVLLELYAGVGAGHRALFGERMEFLPLMLVSVYCAGGVLVAFCMLTMFAFNDGDDGT